jgi:hypothetical protein
MLMAIVAQQLLQGTEPTADGTFEVRVDALVDADGKPLTPPGEDATGVASIRLVTATPEEGDPDNRLWAITFPGAETAMSSWNSGIDPDASVEAGGMYWTARSPGPRAFAIFSRLTAFSTRTFPLMR